MQYMAPPISQKIKKVVQLANFSTREILQIEDVEEAIVGEKCAGSFNEKAFSEVTKRKSEAWVVLLRHSFSHFENRMNCHCILYNLAEIIANFVRHAIIENNIGCLWRKKGFLCVNWRSIKRCCSIVRTVFFDLKQFFVDLLSSNQTFLWYVPEIVWSTWKVDFQLTNWNKVLICSV